MVHEICSEAGMPVSNHHGMPVSCTSSLVCEAGTVACVALAELPRAWPQCAGTCAVQVCDPDLRGRSVVVTGMFPAHDNIRAAMPRADLVMHDAWHGDAERVRARGLSSAADAARFAASVGAAGLLLSSRGALCGAGARPQACTASQSRALEAQASAAAPELTVAAPDDLHLAVVGHADEKGGA